MCVQERSGCAERVAYLYTPTERQICTAASQAGGLKQTPIEERAGFRFWWDESSPSLSLLFLETAYLSDDLNEIQFGETRWFQELVET